MMNYKETQAAAKILIEVYRNMRLEGPRAAVEAGIRCLGRDKFMEALAALVKCKRHDGRISRRNKEFYNSIPSWTEDGRNFLYEADRIHPAHLQQLAEIASIYF